MKYLSITGLALGALLLSTSVTAIEPIDFLAQHVADGTLPPMAERLPDTPRVIDVAASGRTPGQYGGDIRMLMAASQDIRMMNVYGYARLVVYDRDFNLQPDIAESYEVEEGRIFTFHLRKGHKWSDGAPFTSEDFRYFWEDVATNEELYPFGPEKILLIGDQKPVVTFPDELTVRYEWSKPNPYFLPALAGARPLYIYQPAHYMKQFHAGYADAAKLEEMVRDAAVRNWASLHTRMARQYKATNIDLPVLQPWINTTAPPSERFVFERNPYFHRVDERGQQLPYVDRLIVNTVSKSLIPAKAGSGEADLQARYIRLDNYTFLKEGEERNGYTVNLWQRGTGAQVALYPNLNSTDDTWRNLARDVRFRRALSLATDRTEINSVVYFGLGQESANTVLPTCPLFSPELQTSWAQFDLDKANALLDEIGLTRRNSEGVRLMSDGRPLEIVVHTAGESTEQTDVLELIHDTWIKAGIKIFTKPSQREVFRDRVFAGEAMMSVWSGVDNGLPTATTSPNEFVPVAQDQLQWPKWGQYFETNGGAGEAPDMPSAKRLLELRSDWQNATNDEERRAAWKEILEIHRDEVFSIGIVCGVMQPVVVNNALQNVPSEGFYSWEPGAYFGIYQPDTFWYKR
ncbi:MAG: peptide ABC transporter substrate-binding protein [marine bacterium B5-7]|nr:MAG: peptide ABC transporter substrate-binding protein [marine bacterium B5-7]